MKLTLNVDIEVEELLAQVSDEDIMDELYRRGWSKMV